jgi:hypothetical protein
LPEKEIPISQELLADVLSSISPESVLVGGQALAFWVSHYDIPLQTDVLVGAISDDADILGFREDVERIARKVNGSPHLMPRSAITALIGQVRIPVHDGEYVNVDVLDQLVGVSAFDARQHASVVTLRGVEFLVMHPIDVFESRIKNLGQLRDKQNPEGIEQARLGVQVAARYIRELAESGKEGQTHARKVIEHLVKIAKSSAGRRVAREFGVQLSAAIPAYVITSKRFHEIRWPQIAKELQTAAGEEVE